MRKGLFNYKKVDGEYYIVNPDGSISKDYVPSLEEIEAVLLADELNKLVKKDLNYIDAQRRLLKVINSEEFKNLYEIDEFDDWMVAAAYLKGSHTSYYENDGWNKTKVSLKISDTVVRLSYFTDNTFDENKKFVDEGWNERTIARNY